jgi:hypothetical protein
MEIEMANEIPASSPPILKLDKEKFHIPLRSYIVEVEEIKTTKRVKRNQDVTKDQPRIDLFFPVKKEKKNIQIAF